MPDHITATLGELSYFDMFAGGVAIIVASGLWMARKQNGRGNEHGQWFADALTVGTIVVLFAIGIHAIIGDHWGFGEIAKANMLLVALAFLYSTGVLIRSLWKSVEPRLMDLPKSP